MAANSEAAAVPAEEEKRDEEEEEIEEEEQADEEGTCNLEADEDGVAFGRRISAGRGGVTLPHLLKEGLLKPGEGAMSIDYLGKKFVGDLLTNGKIRWQETKEIFNSPSAWAIHCKKIINPEKKSGCGWASVKYRGQKLDSFKTAWLRRRKRQLSLEQFEDVEVDGENIAPPPPPTGPLKSVKHNTLGHRTLEHNTNTPVECTPFGAMGKIQPFTVTFAVNSLFLMDLHSHLTGSEVVGYLGGRWDVQSHNLIIQQALPCKCRLADKENSARVQEEIRNMMVERRLQLVGWYHSHPYSSVHPTLKDIDRQLDYQIKMKGKGDTCYSPIIGVICSPYDRESHCVESIVQAYWVMPPPENRPNEYGKPMLMTSSLVQEASLLDEVKAEMQALLKFYKNAPDFIHFEEEWRDGITHAQKLQKSLAQKAPLDQTETSLQNLIKEFLLPNQVVVKKPRIEEPATDATTVSEVPEVSDPVQLD